MKIYLLRILILIFFSIFILTFKTYGNQVDGVASDLFKESPGVFQQKSPPLTKRNKFINQHAMNSQYEFQKKQQLLQSRIFELEGKLKYIESDIYKAEAIYYKKYYEYKARKADINLSQFEWQQYASNYMLWLVIIVVLSGVLFSGYQLWKASQINDLSSDSSIELSIQKIKVTSSVVGVIVLAISIVFLYFFLIEVYRVNVIDIDGKKIKPPVMTEQHINSLNSKTDPYQ